MPKYLKKFENHTQYDAYINGSGAILPNVSICTTEGDVHYNPYVPETRVVAKFNVTYAPVSINIVNRTTGFSSIEIDGIEQQSVTTYYTFDTTGEHTVKYTLTDPTSIGTYAFQNCSGLTSVFIPDSVTTIGNGAFYYCIGMTSCTIGNGVTSIGDRAFYLCSDLTSIGIPDSVTSIGQSAFEQCSGLTKVIIPSNVTNIGGSAFYYCTGLTSCTIGSGVTTIGNSAFAYCSSLTSIVSNATTAPTISSATLLNVKTGGTLTVPQGSSGYDTWMQNANYYLGLYNWTKVEQ